MDGWMDGWLGGWNGWVGEIQLCRLGGGGVAVMLLGGEQRLPGGGLDLSRLDAQDGAIPLPSGGHLQHPSLGSRMPEVVVEVPHDHPACAGAEFLRGIGSQFGRGQCLAEVGVGVLETLLQARGQPRPDAKLTEEAHDAPATA